MLSTPIQIQDFNVNTHLLHWWHISLKPWPCGIVLDIRNPGSCRDHILFFSKLFILCFHVLFWNFCCFTLFHFLWVLISIREFIMIKILLVFIHSIGIACTVYVHSPCVICRGSITVQQYTRCVLSYGASSDWNYFHMQMSCGLINKPLLILHALHVCTCTLCP